MEPNYTYIFPSDEEARAGLTAAANAPLSSHPLAFLMNDNLPKPQTDLQKYLDMTAPPKRVPEDITESTQWRIDYTDPVRCPTANNVNIDDAGRTIDAKAAQYQVFHGPANDNIAMNGQLHIPTINIDVNTQAQAQLEGQNQLFNVNDHRFQVPQLVSRTHPFTPQPRAQVRRGRVQNGRVCKPYTKPPIHSPNAVDMLVTDVHGMPTGNTRFTKDPLNLDVVDSDDQEMLQKDDAAMDVL
ncbi:hypothetical protein CVT24_006571 [Panaeolus cyanescens]|uniref:Uncharacterized protein n=1 Tax=Panaeolus cyanescens TaxID=181874 RepID=A0A409WCB9_9AGAR|nr:hypothetical protein CVT24_006571 [Panaeolus cyanescens]